MLGVRGGGVDTPHTPLGPLTPDLLTFMLCCVDLRSCSRSFLFYACNQFVTTWLANTNVNLYRPIVYQLPFKYYSWIKTNWKLPIYLIMLTFASKGWIYLVSLWYYLSRGVILFLILIRKAFYINPFFNQRIAFTTSLDVMKCPVGLFEIVHHLGDP